MKATPTPFPGRPDACSETVRAGYYDFPKYYDLVFGSDWRQEVRFLEACFEKHAGGRVRRLFEPACGTGRLLYRFGKRGYQVSGLDLNAKAVDFCNRRLVRHGLCGRAVVADMAEFRLPRTADAAFNTINSFRHLKSERAARSHLECMARALRGGGIYVIGLHLTPTKGTISEDERWSARRGNLHVTTSMRMVARDLHRRVERFAVVFHVTTPSRQMKLQDQLVLRTYTAAQFERLVRQVPAFEIAETYDFQYTIQQPAPVTEYSEDVVYVLKKAAQQLC